MKNILLASTSLVLLLGVGARPAQAMVTINAVESAGDVVFTASGSVNTAGLYFLFDLGSASRVSPSSAFIYLGFGDISNYNGITGPTDFGTGGSTDSTTYGGSSPIGVYGDLGLLILPLGYVSGSAISASANFGSTTLAGLGLTVGTYTWTWGSGATADSLVLNVGAAPPAAVPEPASLALLGAGLLGLGAARRRRAA